MILAPQTAPDGLRPGALPTLTRTAAAISLVLLLVACGEPVNIDPTDSNDAGAISADGGAGLRTGCIQGNFAVYYGNLHSHTSYSDGEETPADAFTHARDVAGIDMLAVTDHVEQLHIGERWPSCLEQAALADESGVFVATCGYEYGSGYSLITSTGHNNVFFVAELMPVVQLDFHDFYDSLVACETCVGQYSHPGDDDAQTWDDFEYFPDVDERMSLFELNGGGPVWELFFAALDAGWHLSPMYNQDNHSANWGSANDRRSAFLIDLYGPTGTLLETYDCGGARECSARFTLPVSSSTYAVARAEQADGDYLVCAPIWAKP